MQNKGRLLCDISKSNWFKKVKRLEYSHDLFFGLLLIFSALILFMIVVLRLTIAVYADIFLVLLGFLLILFAIFGFLKNVIFIYNSLTGPKIYEYGLVLPWRTNIQIRKKEENYISYHEIKNIYFNMKNDLDYIIIEMHNGNLLDIDKKFLPNLKEFKKYIKNKVNIILNKNFKIPIDQRWFVHCRKNINI